jgi:uncharacterized membrane protein
VTKLSEIFSSKAQAALIEYLIRNKGKFFNQIALAAALDLSSSTIARLVDNLAKLKIVKYDRFDRGIKVIILDDENPLTKTILNFYLKVKEIE